MNYIVLIVFFIIIITVILLFLFLKKNKQKKPLAQGKKRRKKTENNTKQTYINPTNFDVGLIKEKTDASSNLCNHKVLYPINGLGVDYGSKMPDGCPCDQFIRPP